MITEDYVSLETAKLLKEKGFDWCCGNSYLNENGVILFPKPTLQMAMKMAEYMKQQMIEKALKWLPTHIPNYNYDFEVAFKQAMEE